MREIHKIVVPIDFNQHTDQLAEFATDIAQTFNADVKFIHVVEPYENYSSYAYPSLGPLTNEVVEHTEGKMKQFVKKNRERFSSCEGKILQGNIVDSIIRYVNEESGDLIIIGTHGRKGLERLWLGSVAERVIKSAPCPTLTCNPYREEE
jgi:nucleotide-binding universal stress UspA family protein